MEPQIVGGGNAGLVAAMRLSVDGNYSVAVIEAGGFYQTVGNVTEIPAYESEFLEVPDSIDWEIMTKPQMVCCLQISSWLFPC